MTSVFSRRNVLKTIALGGVALSSVSRLAAPALAQGAKIPLRIGFASVGLDNRQFGGSSTTSQLHVHKWLEEALADRPEVEISWHFFKGAGPAVNEALAAGQLDFAHQGDFPAITGRANGIDSRILAITRNKTPSYIAARKGAEIKDIPDLKGKTLAYHFGTNTHLAVGKILESGGLGPRDVTHVNLTGAASKAAIAVGEIDAAFGDVSLFDLQDKGLAEVFYSTKGKDPRFEKYSHFSVASAFDTAHGDLVATVVDQITRAAHWSSLEENREAYFENAALSGESAATFRRDFEGQTLADRSNPLLDDFIFAQYRNQARLAREFGLLRRDVPTDDWFKTEYLAASVKKLGLEGFWQQRDPDGKVV